MISFDFSYHCPNSIDQAIKLYHELQKEGKTALYYGGGTEFISRARVSELQTDAIIDLKRIPECNEYTISDGNIIIGACITLTKLVDFPHFALLKNVARHIAHRTARNKITIGGNLSSNLIYREAALPFLLTDSEVVIAGSSGLRKIPIDGIYHKKIKQDEFIVQIIMNNKFTMCEYASRKKTRQTKVGYPIVSLAALKANDEIRFAVSGVCSFPFRSKHMEDALNDTSHSYKVRIDQALNHLPDTIMDDMYASKEYRKFVLTDAITEILETMEGVSK